MPDSFSMDIDDQGLRRLRDSIDNLAVHAWANFNLETAWLPSSWRLPKIEKKLLSQLISPQIFDYIKLVKYKHIKESFSLY